MKLYLTRWALTRGILEAEAAYSDAFHEDPSADHVRVLGAWTYFRLNRDAFTTLEAAQARAREMAAKKILALTAQLAKLQTMASCGAPVSRYE